MAITRRLPVGVWNMPFSLAVWSAMICGLTLPRHALAASEMSPERGIAPGAALIVGLLALFVAIAGLGRWVALNEDAIKRRWVRWLKHPVISRLSRHVAPRIASLRAHLTPISYLGLHLALGAAILIAASWVFGGIAEDVVGGDPLTEIDSRVAGWFHHHAVPGLTRVMLWISAVHAAPGILLMTLAIGLFLAWQRDRYGLLALVLVVPGGMLLNVLTKHALHRTRPHFDDPILLLTDFSFPSGHATAAALLYGLLAALIIGRVRQWRYRVMVVCWAVCVVLLVGLSRLYLGAHYLSDVLAGYAQAIAWLALCLTATTTMRDRALAVKSRVSADP